MVSPGFFETVSIPLLAGRDFTDSDSTPEPTVAIVNESFVRKFNLGSDAVGTTLRFTWPVHPPGRGRDHRRGGRCEIQRHQG